MFYNLDGIFNTFGGNTMNDMIRIDDEYIKWLKNIKNRFKKTQIKAAIKVNEEMLRFYGRLEEILSKCRLRVNGEAHFLIL